MLATGRWGAEHLSNGHLPLLQPVGKSFYRQLEGAMYINSTVSSDCHLEIGPEWSDQHHIDCFKYS